MSRETVACVTRQPAFASASASSSWLPQRLRELADKAASRGDGIGEWLSEELRHDAVFLRKLKPSLIQARAKGNAPTNREPVAAVPSPDPGEAPTQPKPP